MSIEHHFVFAVFCQKDKVDRARGIAVEAYD